MGPNAACVSGGGGVVLGVGEVTGKRPLGGTLVPQGEPKRIRISHGHGKVCPHCGETVGPRTLVCKYCCRGIAVKSTGKEEIGADPKSNAGPSHTVFTRRGNNAGPQKPGRRVVTVGMPAEELAPMSTDDELQSAKERLAILEETLQKMRGSLGPLSGEGSEGFGVSLKIKIPRAALLPIRGENKRPPVPPSPPSPTLSSIFGRPVQPKDLECLGDSFGIEDVSESSRCLSVLSSAPPSHLVKHIQSLRMDFLSCQLRPILSRLMSSTVNRQGIFNYPVDPVAQGIPDYFKIVQKPMDLGTIKGRLQALHYTDLNEFADDIRLTFKNAITFNPPTHSIHECAQQLLAEFETEWAKVSARLVKDEQKRSDHDCQLCQGQTCQLCGDKCLKLDPAVLICHGPCAQRIKRGCVYFITPDACRLWCQKCHMGLPQEIVEPGEVDDGEGPAHPPLRKKELLRRKFDDEVSESWVQCDGCSLWLHQVCALFNARANVGEAKLTCSICRLKRAAAALNASSEQTAPAKVEPAEDSMDVVKDEERDAQSSQGEVAGSTAAAPPVAAPAPALHDSNRVYSAAALPQSHMGSYIERRVYRRLHELGVDPHEHGRITIRVISSVDNSHEVPLIVKRMFKASPGGADAPDEIEYVSKALCMFQHVDGAEVCLFSMYVQEYGVHAPEFNARRAYISYLDSVEYFRPRHARTHVYHEILASYLDWVRRRGFKTAHFWSCPPQRGNNFIFWCHPVHQRTPTRDRLAEWYRRMLQRCKDVGIAESVSNLHSSHFQEVARCIHQHRTDEGAPPDTRPEIPPVFEGDYWIEEIQRLHRLVEKKSDADFVAARAPRDLCRAALAQLSSQPQAAPFLTPVDPVLHCCPDYWTIVKAPMDLGTVAKNLSAGLYPSAHEFAEDVRLVFRNATEYNPPKHAVHTSAKHLAAAFDRALKRLLKVARERAGKPVTLAEIKLGEEDISLAGAENDPSSACMLAPEPCPSAALEGTPDLGALCPLQGRLTRTWSIASTTGFHSSSRSGDKSGCSTPLAAPTPRRASISCPWEITGRPESTDPAAALEKCEAAALEQRRPSVASDTTDVELMDASDEGEPAALALEDGSRHGSPAHEKLAPLKHAHHHHGGDEHHHHSSSDDACEGGVELPPPPSSAMSDSDCASRSEEGSSAGSGGGAGGAAQTVSGNKCKWLLSQLCKSVDLMKRDLLVVALAEPGALPVDAAWEEAVPVGVALDPATCYDPDPHESRALVDSRHTFLEMCQFRHYQFDSLRRAKYSSAMILYHLHRPEAHSLNPFCNKCKGAVKGVRYHCSRCNYELCSECSRETGCKCLEGHLLNPWRVTFSAETTDEVQTCVAAGHNPAPPPAAAS